MNKLKNMLYLLLAVSIFIVSNSCSFITSFTEKAKNIKGMSFDKTSIELSTGTMDLLNLTIKTTSGQQNVAVSWEYDSSIIAGKCDNYGIVITGLQTGSTIIRAKAGDYSAICTVRVLEKNALSKIENPYVYVNQDYITVLPGSTEKVFASLYGGTQSDLNGYTFTIDKPSIASVYVEGNYCWITGISEGLARVTARNSKSPFGYSFLVNCTTSSLAIPYITTKSNIITINKSTESTKTFEVDMVNPLYPTFADDFTYSITDENGNNITENIPIQLTYTGKKCTVTALTSGNCYIKVSHKDCKYSLNVLVRTVENIDTTFIEPSCGSLLEVNGINSESFALSIKGITGNTTIKADDYVWSFSSGAEDYIDYKILGGSGSDSSKGDNIWITGKKSGSVKITVTHPLCSQSRSVVVLVRNIASEASSSNIFITTTQNYIQTQVGAEASTVNITINNLSSGAENDLQWNIENEAADGSTDPVIMYQSGTGQATSQSVFSRSAHFAIPMAFGKAVITPLKEGKATITIAHPKAAYSTKILVIVSKTKMVQSEPYSLSSNIPFMTLLNGKSDTLSVTLTGNGKTTADEVNIQYSCNSPDFSISPNGSNVVVTANGTGTKSAILTVKHKKVPYPLEIRINSFDENNTGESSESSLPFIYTLTTAFTIYTGETCNLQVMEHGTTDSDLIIWEVVSGNSVIDLSNSTKTVSVVHGVLKGSAEVKATLKSTGESIRFYITVKQDGIVNDSMPCYLTTNQNVVTVNIGDITTISVNPINITTSDYKKVKWQNNNPELFTLSANGSQCSITALKEGNGTLTISHPLCANSLTINVHIGSEYVYHNTDIAYISTASDTLFIKSDSKGITFDAVVVHTESTITERNGFTFTSSDNSIFTAEFSSEHSYCIITPKKAGQGILKIHHQGCEDKDVVVIIEKSNAELANIPYISTTQNVITVIAGEYATATAKLENSINVNAAADWTWTSLDRTISDVIVNSGTTCMISGVSPGTTKVKVTQKDCVYPIEIIVICLDSAIVQSKPWIKTSTNIINLKTRDSTSLTAQMIGGTEADSSSFIWSGGNSNVALVNGAGGSCFIKGLKAGFTSVTVRNTNYPQAYQKTVYIRVEDAVKDECYITVTNKIVKMKPTDTNGTTITATLENGELLDAQNFTWWADDYKIVNLVSNTDKCNIVPTGLSGSTIVHVKHPKVLQPIDIIVMFSNYESFTFSTDSKQLQEKSISFIPMQVPATSDKSWIEYTSDNTNVCVVTGSNSICMIAGVKSGYTTIRASLKSNNGVIGTAEMAVIISKKEEALNVISMNSTILNMELGKSQTLEAMLSGSEINTTDIYNLSWSSSDSNILSILQTENGISKGKNAYVTAKKSGEVLLTLSHPKCKFDLQIWVIIPEIEEITLTLDQTYIEMYKDDGATTVAANIVNGTTADLNSITWTAPKVGGQVIISISKATGKTCNIMPKAIGSTTLRAQLPNGNYADCIVTVLANAEIILETKSIHVNPGFSEVISYTTTPENVSLNWIPMMNNSTSFGSAQEELFTYVVNETLKTITITGRKIGTGSLNGYFASSGGTASCILNVKVEYNYDLTLNTPSIIETKPKNDALFDIPFTVYPKTLDISATATNPSVLEVKQITFDKETGKGVVTVKPLKEGIGETVTITATNPNDLINTPIKRTQIVTSQYKKLHITPVFDFSSGSFSRYEGNTLYLGDGEDVLFYLDVAEENATMDNIIITYNQTDKNTPSTEFTYKQSGIFNPIVLKDRPHKNDKVLESDNHLFFSHKVNDVSGVLSPETTTAKGKHFYRIGHNYDYIKKETSYLVKGAFNSPIKSIYLNGYYNYHHWKRWYYAWGWVLTWEWALDETKEWWLDVTLNNGKKIKKSTNVTALRIYHESICENIDKNYYAIEKSVFENEKKYYLNDFNHLYYKSYDFMDNRTRLLETKYSRRVQGSIHPYDTGVKLTETKNSDKDPRIGTGNLSISYTDSSGKTTNNITIPIHIEVRQCRKSTNGYWEKAKVDGHFCYKLINRQGLSASEAAAQVDNFYMFPDEESPTLYTGQEKEITLTHNFTTNNFKWSVDKPSILSLTQNGKSCIIKALRSGNAKIKIKRNDSSTASEIDVTVRKLDIDIEGIDKDTKTTSFEEEQDMTFYVTSKDLKQSDFENMTLSFNNEAFNNKALVTIKSQTIENKKIKFVLTALKKGKTTILIKHPYIEDDIGFSLKVTPKPRYFTSTDTLSLIQKNNIIESSNTEILLISNDLTVEQLKESTVDTTGCLFTFSKIEVRNGKVYMVFNTPDKKTGDGTLVIKNKYAAADVTVAWTASYTETGE